MHIYELRANQDMHILDDGVAEITECTKLQTKEWLEIYQWGEQSGELSRLQLDIARRMVELATEDWRRTPTSRQASEGAKIIESYGKRT